jgi:linoleate 10R-lipoxygenase
VEILGMQQARYWRLGSLNEFRKFFGLEQHKSFESINSDPKVAEHLRHLYEHPDFVEMYPGIVAEEAKEPMVPGKPPLAYLPLHILIKYRSWYLPYIYNI